MIVIRFYSPSCRHKVLTENDRVRLQKSLSIYPRTDGRPSIVGSGLFDVAISLQPRSSILSASLFQAAAESPAVSTDDMATPGTSLHKAAPQILQYCQAHDGNTFLPLFPPGRLLHIKVNGHGKTW